MTRAARDLFSSEEDALEFLEDYDLDEARAEMLKESGRVLESARIHANEGDMLKAVVTLTTSAVQSVDHVRPAIEYLLAGLWQGLTFGALPSSTPIVSELLGLAGGLDRSAMTQQEVNEESLFSSTQLERLTPQYLQLAMFEAIQNADHTSLHALAKAFIETGNDPAALMCLDHVFSSPPKLRQLSLVHIHASLSIYLDYIRLLDRFWRDDSLAEGSKHQRLFGFRVLGEDRYLVPKHTLVNETLANQTIGSEENADGYTCTYGELSWGIMQLISGRIYNHTRLENNACRDAHGFSPCLTLIVRGQCKWGESCDFQHIQSDHLTIEWYHARIRLILLQFQILNSARYYPWPVIKCVPEHSGRYKLILITHKAIG